MVNIRFQGFEGTAGDNWTFAVTPATYNTEMTGDPLEVNGDEDVWARIKEFTGDISSPATGTFFWGIEDLNNPSGGGNFNHTLDFDPIDITTYTNVVLEFKYSSIGFDGPDTIEYIVEYDNGTTWGTTTPLSKDTSGAWTPTTINVPDSANFVRLRLQANQDGADDFAGWDDIQLTGDVTADITPPLAMTFTPADDGTSIAIDANLAVSFNENVQLGTGNIVIKRISDDSTVEIFDVTSSSQLSLSGNTITIDPTSDLDNATGYYVEIDAGAIEDLSGNDHAGFSGNSTWNFTTIAPSTPDIFISEYVEGSSNNKAVEFYNPTGSAIDLDGADDYTIEFSFNGGASTQTIDLTGTIAAGEVYVLADDSADPAILAVANQTDASAFFNGNDAIVLKKNGIVIDAIGQVGFDPGTEWGTGDTSTEDNTLRRKSSITSGDLNPNDVFDPAIEWEGFPVDSFDNLGIFGTPPPPAMVPNKPPANIVPTDVATDENTELIFSIAKGNAISVSDADNDTLTIKLTTSNGIVALVQTTGLTFTEGDGSEDETLRFSGSIADINSALEGLTFFPTEDFNGDGSLEIMSADSASNSDTDTIAIAVNAIDTDSTVGSESQNSFSPPQETPIVFDSGNSVRVSNESSDPCSLDTLRNPFPGHNETMLMLTGSPETDVMMTGEISEAIAAFGGDDRVLGLGGNDNIFGHDGDDTLAGNQGDDYIDGDAGDDLILGGKGNDATIGNGGNDAIAANLGDDRVRGDVGNDTLFGNQGRDLLDGGDGDDFVRGGQGDDLIGGGNGNDILTGDLDSDCIHGENGSDVLFGNRGNDTINGGIGNDTIWAGKDDDAVSGGDGNDVLLGDNGNDTLYGGTNNDTLIGEIGNDVLFGDEGDDFLIGGGGSNIFVLQSNGGSDTFTDFTSGSDLIQLTSGIAFDRLTISVFDGNTLIELNDEVLATVMGAIDMGMEDFIA